jgi:hypothetical protein
LGWPAGRRDPFEKAPAAVLSEQNPSHRSRLNFRPEDLADPAGWVAASVLASGVDDLAVDGSELALASRPSLDATHVEAALKSRAFATTELGRVTPAHRTVAEFLAGRWLARTVDTAVHEARLRALVVASDGTPPVSLRGLFAWTVNFLPPQKARTWLDVDPVGLVRQGDVAILQAGQRIQLLEALARSASADPDMGGWSGGADRWAHLITDETAATLERLIQSAAVSDSLKVRLLEGAASNVAPDTLLPMLLRLAQDPVQPVALRYRAVEAYLAANADPVPIEQLFDTLNGSSADDPECIIRGAILSAIPKSTAAMVFAATTAIARRRNRVDLGRISSSVARLPLEEVEVLLDQLLPVARSSRTGARSERLSQAELSEVMIRTVARA